ncbi:kinase domain protein [Ceratobasidium sp. AG-Ba]|nr:kinase domain protein [Ceratobasidium sp. AG-Ba]
MSVDPTPSRKRRRLITFDDDQLVPFFPPNRVDELDKDWVDFCDEAHMVELDQNLLHSPLSEYIAARISDDKHFSLPTMLRLFKNLVLEPHQKSPPRELTVISFDEAEDAWGHELAQMLYDSIPRLPTTLRILLKFRTQGVFGVIFSDGTYVRPLDYDTATLLSLGDVMDFTSYQLGQLDLGEGWPNSKLLARVLDKAANRFLWVNVLCDFLRGVEHPSQALDGILLATSPIDDPEAHIDQLYTTMSRMIDWNNPEVVYGYFQVMDTLTGVRVPLSIHAINALQNNSISSNLSPRKHLPLFECLNGSLGERKARLPPALRSFLVRRASHTPHLGKLHQLRSQISVLGLSCLDILSRELANRTNNSLYFVPDPICNTGGCGTLEALWYACQFWADHMLAADSSGVDVLETFGTFIRESMMTWMRLMALHGKSSLMFEIRRKILRHKFRGSAKSTARAFVEHYAHICHFLIYSLDYLSRQKDALEMMEEACSVYRLIVKEDPSPVSPAVISSIVKSLACLAEPSLHSQVFHVAKELALLCEQLPIRHLFANPTIQHLPSYLSILVRRLRELEPEGEEVSIIERFRQLGPAARICKTTPLFQAIYILVQHGCRDITETLDLSACGEYPITSGGFGEVYQGRLKDKSVVALKIMKITTDEFSSEDKLHFKNAAREIYAWSKLNHPFILKCLGLAQFRNQIAMMYFNSDHKYPRGWLFCMTQESLNTHSISFTGGTTTPSFTIRWAAPELLQGASPSVEADI